MEDNQRHIPSDEDRLLKLMEHGAEPDKALLDSLRDDSLRRACMDVLGLASACRRSKEHPDAEAALREFHQQHSARRVALQPRVSHCRWWAVAAAVLVLVGLSALLLPRLPGQKPPVEQSATTLSRQPVLLADGDREMPVSMESMFKPVTFTAQPRAAHESPVKLMTAEAAAGENRVVTLPDGSRVYLYPHSRLSYPSRFDGEERRVSFSGKATFCVRHDARHPFFVDAAGVETKVLGTVFNVCTYEGAPTRVTLISGSVQVCDAYHCVVLQPCEQVRFFDYQATDVIKADTLTYTRWLQGEFYYHDARLSHVIEDLCRYYDYNPTDILCDTPHDHIVSLQVSRRLGIRQVLALLNKSNGGVNIRLK
uniref:FecR family protein n=1 Tax=Prevotella sp. TaxID=59823 RepID=UPI004028ED2F